MVRFTKEIKKEMMDNFIIDAEIEINNCVNMEDDENEEYYKYMKDEYNWSIKKNILQKRNDEEKNLIELRIKRDNNVYNNKKRGESIDESCWVSPSLIKIL